MDVRVLRAARLAWNELDWRLRLLVIVALTWSIVHVFGLDSWPAVTVAAIAWAYAAYLILGWVREGYREPSARRRR